jgi:hypothetical protein
MGLAGFVALGPSFAITLSKTSFPHTRRTTMKFETVILQSLFAACLLVCLLTLGAMLAPHTTASNIAANHAPVTTSAGSAS